MSEKFMVSFGPKDTPFGGSKYLSKITRHMNSNVPHPQIPSTTPPVPPRSSKVKSTTSPHSGSP